MVKLIVKEIQLVRCIESNLDMSITICLFKCSHFNSINEKKKGEDRIIICGFDKLKPIKLIVKKNKLVDCPEMDLSIETHICLYKCNSFRSITEKKKGQDRIIDCCYNG